MPSCARQGSRRIGQALADVQHRVRVVEIPGWYWLMTSEGADVLIGERNEVSVDGELQSELHRTGLCSRREGSFQAHTFSAARHVPLPANPSERKTLLHEETVPWDNPI